MGLTLNGHRIAVVEDDPEYRDAVLVPILARSGFKVSPMGSALELYRAMLSEAYDLVLLDVDLPDDDGFSIATHLRGLSPSVGIVMLTGLGSGADRMRGLEAGVDAYLTKPVEMNELVATLRNLVNRIQAQPADRDDADTGLVAGRLEGAAPTGRANAWRLDGRGWRILPPGGGEVALNLAERQVMAMLAATPGVPVGRAALIGRLVEDVHDFDPHRLEMLVYRLRRKCLRETGLELPVRAVRGVGYMLAW